MQKVSILDIEKCLKVASKLGLPYRHLYFSTNEKGIFMVSDSQTFEILTEKEYQNRKQEFSSVYVDDSFIIGKIK